VRKLCLILLTALCAVGAVAQNIGQASGIRFGTTTPSSCFAQQIFIRTGATAPGTYACRSGSFVRLAFIDEVGGGAGNGITSFNGATGATQVLGYSATGTAPAWLTDTVNGTHTLKIPNASATSVTAGLLSNTDYVLFQSKQAGLGFTPENASNKDANGGYASLNGSGDVPVTEIPDLSSIYTTRAREGFASGVATLDGGGKVPTSQLPQVGENATFTGDKTINGNLNVSGNINQTGATPWSAEGSFSNISDMSAAASSKSKIGFGLKGLASVSENGGAVWHIQKNYAVNVTPVTVASANTETDLQSITIPASDLDLGKVITVNVRGGLSTLSSAAGNITLKFYVGSTVVATTGAVALVAAKTGAGWSANLYLIGKAAAGAAASVQAIGMFENFTAGTSPVATGADGNFTLATNGSLAVKMTATFTVASASNTITSEVMKMDRN
jgi:hypothetical protein